MFLSNLFVAWPCCADVIIISNWMHSANCLDVTYNAKAIAGIRERPSATLNLYVSVSEHPANQ